MWLREQIPNALTLSNLAAGCVGIYFSFQGDLTLASFCIGFGLLADFFDGFAARLLGVASPLGKELDSLADVVTFGVLPGFIMFQLLSRLEAPEAVAISMLIIPILSAYRLAKFNIDTRQSHGFIGMPTPSLALFVAALPFISIDSQSILHAITQSIWALSISGWFLALLLVSPLPLLALKFQSTALRPNIFRYLLIAVGVVCLIVFGFTGIPLLILGYVLLSMLQVWVEKR
jgi:CDP-diacylglycerol--serine O-phosphatidyltransferase